MKIKPEIDKVYDEIKDPMNRHLCKVHHQRVFENLKKLTDDECLYVAAYLHDIGLYLGLRGKHAITSANYAAEFLRRFDLFSEDEIQLIYDVIKVHSDKDKIHFKEAELLKQADRKAHHLSDFM